MEPESPSPYPQVPATCPYPEPTPSSPHDPLQLPEDGIDVHKGEYPHQQNLLDTFNKFNKWRN